MSFFSRFLAAGELRLPRRRIGGGVLALTFPIAIVVVAAAAATTASAIGFGKPLNVPLIGKPLAIDIPLVISAGETIPSSECIRLLPSGEAGDRQFFPRNAHAVVEGGSRPYVRISSTEILNDPLVEFRLSLGCGNSFARDFLVLSETLPPIRAAHQDIAARRTTDQPPAPAAMSPVMRPQEFRLPAPAVAQRVRPSLQTITAPAAPAGSGTLLLDRDTNLNTLARARYPDSLSTRDEYRRLIAAANPALFAGSKRVGSVALPAGTQLNLPTDLPLVESGTIGPASPPEKPANKDAPMRKGQVANSTMPGKDRLSIGGETATGLKPIRPLTPRELAGSIDRMERMIEDQGRTEHAMVSNLETLNSAFIEVKNYVQSLEQQQRRLESAQQAFQIKTDSQPEPKTLGALELLGLILSSGAMGAGLLALHHRQQLQRIAAANAAPLPALAGSPPQSSPADVLEPPPDTAADLPTEITQQHGGPPEYRSPTPVQPPGIDVPSAAVAPTATRTVVEHPPLEFLLPDLELPEISKASSSAPEGDEAVELADIMTSMGLGKEAARTLVEHVLADPKRELAPWLKALDIFRNTNQRDEFESLAENLRQHLNVNPLGWETGHRRDDRTLIDFQHLAERLTAVWPTSGCAAFLDDLLLDNREGARQGFPQQVAEEIMLLQRIVRDTRG